MNVVALEGDQVVRASEIETPIVMAVTGSGPRGRAVYLRVGDGDAVGGFVSQHYVLTANEGCLLMSGLVSVYSYPSISMFPIIGSLQP